MPLRLGLVGPDSSAQPFAARSAAMSASQPRTAVASALRDLALDELPSFLLPRKGSHGLIDYEKMYCSEVTGGPDIFDHRGINRAEGAIVVVRPDQYVVNVLPLDAYGELSESFTGVMTVVS